MCVVGGDVVNSCLIQYQIWKWTGGEQLLHGVSDVEMDRWLNSYYIQCPGSGQGVKSVMEMDKEVIL